MMMIDDGEDVTATVAHADQLRQAAEALDVTPEHAGVRPAQHREREHGAATDPESEAAFIRCSERRRLAATRTRLVPR